METPCPAAQVALGNQSEPLCLDFGSADYSLAAGYAHPQAHVEAPGGQQCRKQVARQQGQHFLPSSVDVGGLHISAPGWEGWILQGLQVLRQPQPCCAGLHACRHALPLRKALAEAHACCPA